MTRRLRCYSMTLDFFIVRCSKVNLHLLLLAVSVIMWGISFHYWKIYKKSFTDLYSYYAALLLIIIANLYVLTTLSAILTKSTAIFWMGFFIATWPFVGFLANGILRKVDVIKGLYPVGWLWEEEKTRFFKCVRRGFLALLFASISYLHVRKEYPPKNSYP